MNKKIIELGVLFCLCVGLSGCSSDNDNHHESFNVMPVGNWYGSVSNDSSTCEAEFGHYKINGKDSTLCTLTIEDIKNSKVYLMTGGASFAKDITTVKFSNVASGVTQAVFKYLAPNNMTLGISGGTVKFKNYNITKTSLLNSAAGTWVSKSDTVTFSNHTKDGKNMSAAMQVHVDGKMVHYQGPYTYDHSKGTGTITDTATKQQMTFTIVNNNTSFVNVLTVVSGKNIWVLNRFYAS
jgi:hypothetical protein